MTAPVQQGDILAGKYRVERVLGVGGMGVVVAATHLDLDQKVALKFLLPAALAHPEMVERFAREARTVAKIRSQHVVRVIDTGKMEDGTPFMVMEYLEGKDLSELLLECETAGTHLPLEAAVDHVLEACEAMAEAHAAGIVHRDLKPANLFLARQADRRSIVKVLDFGISKLVDPASQQLTRTATMMGSAHYMSPEQLTSSKHVDARADIWALGVILYELVAGERPYEAETMPEIVARILGNTPRPLAELRPEVPPALAATIARCLASAPDQRFASVAELATALAPFASDVARAEGGVNRISRVLGPSVRPGKLAEGAARALVTSTGTHARPEDARALAAVGTDLHGLGYVSTQMAASIVTPPAPHATGRTRRSTMILAGAALLAGSVVVYTMTRHAPADVSDRATSGAPSRDPVPAIAAETDRAQAPPVLPPPPAPESQPASAPAPHATRGAPPRPSKPAPSARGVTTPAVTATSEKKNPLDMGIK
jgi:tRNA A-37 threonylcarbamoyl transferase component Bud32